MMFKVLGQYLERFNHVKDPPKNGALYRADIVNTILDLMAGKKPNGDEWQIFSFGDFGGTFENPIYISAVRWMYIQHLINTTNGQADIHDILMHLNNQIQSGAANYKSQNMELVFEIVKNSQTFSFKGREINTGSGSYMRIDTYV